MLQKVSTILFILILSSMNGFAQNQDTLPYRELPAHPESYSANNMASRMIDGLGFRFYWATEGLREEDLTFRSSEKSRNTEETIDHILSMSNRIVSSIQKTPINHAKDLSFNEKRTLVLNNLKVASDILKKSDLEDLESFKIEFRDGETLPFWNFVNGQIADCIWHCGQIATYRRMSGNPFNSKVNLLKGEVSD